ncbi:MAG: hypothetical protein BalsKO_18070 [Balneolaceae bacterium]
MSDELELVWQELQTEIKTKTTINKEQIMMAITKESRNPLEQLKKGMMIKRNWCTFFTIVSIIALLFSLSYPAAIAIWFILIAYFVFGAVSIHLDLKKLAIPFDTPIKSLLDSYYKRISKMISMEENIGAFAIPIFGILGFVMFNIYEGKTILEIFSNPKSVGILLALTIIYGIGGFLLAKKMNKKAFGGYLEKLKTNIDLLNAIDG